MPSQLTYLIRREAYSSILFPSEELIYLSIIMGR